MALKNRSMGMRTCYTGTVHGNVARSSRWSLVFCADACLVRWLELL